MVGIGTPAEEQEIFTLSPSLSITVLLPVTVVLAPSAGREGVLCLLMTIFLNVIYLVLLQ